MVIDFTGAYAARNHGLYYDYNYTLVQGMYYGCHTVNCATGRHINASEYCILKAVLSLVAIADQHSQYIYQHQYYTSYKNDDFQYT